MGRVGGRKSLQPDLHFPRTPPPHPRATQTTQEMRGTGCPWAGGKGDVLLTTVRSWGERGSRAAPGGAWGLRTGPRAPGSQWAEPAGPRQMGVKPAPGESVSQAAGT